jgi:Fe-S cluster assembly ATP-binding protein
MGPNGAGKVRLRQSSQEMKPMETDGEIILEDLRELAPEERAHRVFLSFQYPVEIPGVSVTNFIRSAINETRKANGEGHASERNAKSDP